MSGGGNRGGGARVIDGAVYDARSDAARIVADAHAEAEQIRDEARAQGRADGRAEVAALLVRARARIDERLAAMEGEIVALAVRIAERIVRRELALRPDAVVDIVRAALADARGRHEIVLRVHPEDVAVLEVERPGLLARLSVSAHMLIRADETIARGGCVVDSDLGTVDARLATQLAMIERALMEGG